MPQSEREKDWERFRYLLERASTVRGVQALTEDELWELPSLYRKTLSDLSLMRSQGTNPHGLERLSQMCTKAHSLIYRGVAQRSRTSFWEFVSQELPRTVRRRSGYIWASVLVMLLFTVIGWINCISDPTIPRVVLSPQMMGSIESSLAAARDQTELGLAAQIENDERPLMAFLITLNNIGVSVKAFVFGIAGGLPTLIIIAINGYMLGAVGFLYFNTPPGIEINLPLYFISGIAPHGSIELPAICLAGAAGMLLGFSWLFPGVLTRGQALRKAAVDAVRLLTVCAITLLFAGAIEGFVTPIYPPMGVPLEAWFWFKIVIGAVVFAAWLAWLLLGGRAQPRPVLGSW